MRCQNKSIWVGKFLDRSYAVCDLHKQTFFVRYGGVIWETNVPMPNQCQYLSKTHYATESYEEWKQRRH